MKELQEYKGVQSIKELNVYKGGAKEVNEETRNIKDEDLQEINNKTQQGMRAI